MRRIFAPDTLSFMRAEAVEKADVRFPIMMNIEPSLRCNSDCVMCPRTTAVRSVGDMDFGLYEQIVREMAEAGTVEVCNFHKDGEPLMHPQLEEMIELSLSSGACGFAHFNTNALLLDEERSRRLLDCGVQDITMSIDAVSESTFERVKRVSSLALVERNIERLLELRAQRNLTEPWIRAKICAMPETEHEIDSFIERWNGVADEVQVQEVHNYGGGNDGAMQGQDVRYPCQYWWSAMAVNWDGTVSVCAVDYSGEVLLGDLNRQSIADIYRGEAYAEHRRAMLKGDYSSHDLCSRCTVWKVGPDQSSWYRTRKKGMADV